MTAPVPAESLADVRRALHDEAGVTWASVSVGPGLGVEVPRSYGDPAAEYEAARTGAVVIDRSDRGLLRVFGREPVKMVHGLASNDVEGLEPGGSVQATMLTPKGRMLAELRVIRRESDVLLEADVAAVPIIRQNVARYVPPLFARSEDVGDAAVLGVYGAGGEALVGEIMDRHDLSLRMPTDYAGVPGTDIVVSAAALAEVWLALVGGGARPAGHAALDVLRIEAGTPRWGAELDETVIPLEAGLLDRAISTSRGCYTGQEVIIRILHRGHVNRHLRGLLLGEMATPVRGTELFDPGVARAVGRVTSSCHSPRLGQTIALAYVRREVEPGAVVRLGNPEGVEARVVSLPFTAAAGGRNG